MAGLARRMSSPAALQMLYWLASDFMAVPDSFAKVGLRTLTIPEHGDTPIVCGESSVASIGVLLKACREPSPRQKLGIDDKSSIFIPGLEGVTDPETYHRVVELRHEEVIDAQRWHQK